MKFSKIVKNFENKRMKLRFKLRNDLIYYINFDNNWEKLYIFNILKKKKIKFTYNRQYYKEFHRIYN